MKRTLIIMLLAQGVITQAQNGYTATTASLGLTGTLLKESALLVDNVGNKWIGFSEPTSTSNVGLVKQSGATWTVYSTTSSPALPSNYITALAKDASNNIWIGTKAGLVKFDGTNFTTYNTSNGLASNTVTCIETNGTQVYIGSNAGLSRFDGATFTNYNVANGKLPNDTVASIKAENTNTIWLGGNNRLVQFGINNTFSAISYTNNTSTGGKVNCIYVDVNATKWLGTTTVGVLQFNNNIFNNANDIYSISGSYIQTSVLDLSEGVNGGVALKMNGYSWGSSIMGSGIIELAANNKIYQYFLTSNNSFVGNYIEKAGSQLIISQSDSLLTVGNDIIYYNFNKANYETPFLQVNSNNFKYLDINNVKAGIANLSDMHWDIGGSGNSSYEVPKGSGKHSNFASALWIGGIDADGQLHGGSQTYRQNGTDFWPGPLDTTTAITYTLDSKNYDKIWKVTYTDINAFITNFNSGNVQNGSYIPTEDILTWPAKGTGNYSRNLAPFIDVNNNGIYDPTVGGDYPKIKGDQALYFIYNDRLFGATHTETGCAPMGIEVHAMAYAYGCPSIIAGKPELGLTTFYDYKIMNRSINSYSNTYISLWSDVDLGDYQDDYIGCNVKDNYGYAYNADNLDTLGYGHFTPAQGFAILKSPLATTDGIDNDYDGMIDEPDEELGMTKFTYFNDNFPGTNPVTTNPSNCNQFRNYMTGFWKDGTPFTCSGNAFGGTTPTSWAYSGDPNGTISTDPANTCGNWTEISAGNTPNDRRLIVGTGPFNFAPNQMQEVEYALVTSFDSTSTTISNLLSVTKLKTDVQKIKSFYHQTSIPNCLQAITIGINEVLTQNHISVYPNPANQIVFVKNNLIGETTIHYDILDILGKTILSSSNNRNEFSINIADLKTGVYFIRLSINNNTVVKKLIKE